MFASHRTSAEMRLNLERQYKNCGMSNSRVRHRYISQYQYGDFYPAVPSRGGRGKWPVLRPVMCPLVLHWYYIRSVQSLGWESSKITQHILDEERKSI